MASELTSLLFAHPIALVLAVVADLVLGDPQYRFHPVRLMGGSLAAVERGLRRMGADGYRGGIVLFTVLALMWIVGTTLLVLTAGMIAPWMGWALHVFLLYSLLALGDLLHHVRRVERALEAADLPGARAAISLLVGRDTEPMNAAACRRAAVESLSENLTDGFTSPVFWYAIAGLPGLVLFKIVSTMDSMVGYKTPRYLRFGWCGARLDDVMNYAPARLTWLLIAMLALVLPRLSGRKALVVGFTQHAMLPGPNSGWSEAATAGALERKLVGPIWMQGRLVTDAWVGDAADPPLETPDDLRRAATLMTAAGITAVVLASGLLAALR